MQFPWNLKMTIGGTCDNSLWVPTMNDVINNSDCIFHNLFNLENLSVAMETTSTDQLQNNAIYMN